jgi:uncharacterized lipoprotein
MLSKVRIVVVLAAMLVLSGCVMGGQAFPEASPGFIPKLTYTVSNEAAWNAVIAALNANSITITSASKPTGQITTDYITGPSQFVVVSTDNVRYKYTIFVSPQGKGRTAIRVTCALEIQETGENSTTPFHDVGGENAEKTTALRNWLYEQIEKRL